MKRTSVIIGLILAGLSAGCGSAAAPPPSAETAAQASVVGSVAPSGSPSPPPTRSPSPKASPTATPSEAPAPWLTYTSEVFQYSIQYPPDWTVEGASAGTQDYYYANDLYPMFGISRAPKTVSMTQVVANAIKYYTSEYQATVVSDAPIELAEGYAGRILVLEGLDKASSHINIQVVFAAKEDVGYLINWYGWLSETDADKILFETIYRTWRPALT